MLCVYGRQRQRIDKLSTYLRFRKGIRAQGLSEGFLPVKGWLQPFSGWWLLICSPIVLFFSGWYSVLPVFSAPDFVFAYGSVFIFLAILLISKLYEFTVKKRQQIWYTPKEIDFVTDLDKFEAMTVAAEYKRSSKPRSRIQRVEDFLF